MWAVAVCHTAANEKLTMIAKDKKLEVSEDPMLMDKAKAMILEMREKSFDQAYANNQVVAHEQAISNGGQCLIRALFLCQRFTQQCHSVFHPDA